MTVAVKDSIDIAGQVTACGSAALRDAPPAEAHAAVVEAVLAAGCRIIGKTGMHELAYGMTGVNPTFGTPVNPAWPDRIPGGSSSGSAVAVAAGLCDFAIGSDTGGSVRQPAICCGVYGIKPTFGRISRAGCHPAESSLDCVGVFARSAETLNRAMAAVDPGFCRHAPLSRAPRLARIKCDPDPALGEALRIAMQEGAPHAGYVTLAQFDAAFDAGMVLIGAETARAYGHLLDSGAQIGADVRARLEKALGITLEEVARAEAVRASFTAEVDAALETVDALVTPALPHVPPTLTEAEDPAAVLPLTRFLRPFNLSGHPAIVLPMKTGPRSLPAGLQIIGRKGDDAHLCAIAEWIAASFTTLHQKEDIA
ncbi:amidase (plasmid) [Salipiger sp. H15]|uniref:Amidase n=1 Tax=Alloyangia sp. H15 TaxID=3029062 RepID=A0AAU8ASF5_9RHOB